MRFIKDENKWYTQDVYELQSWADGESHIKECLEFMKNRIDVDFEVNHEPDYGSDRYFAQLTGWRYSTEEEISAKRAEEALFKSKQVEAEEKEIERLRKKRPELFK